MFQINRWQFAKTLGISPLDGLFLGCAGCRLAELWLSSADRCMLPLTRDEDEASQEPNPATKTPGSLVHWLVVGGCGGGPLTSIIKKGIH